MQYVFIFSRGSRLVTVGGRILKTCITSLRLKVISGLEISYRPTDATKVPDLFDFYVSMGVSSYTDVRNNFYSAPDL